MAIEDDTLHGDVFCLRPSQIKFEAPEVRTLDIQSTSSRPKAVFLNRPLIMLLEFLGVEPAVISSLQSSAVQEIQSIRTSLPKASQLFMQHNLGSSFRLPSLFNNISETLKLQISDPQDTGYIRHRLIEDVLYCAVAHTLREIKYRAHIYVPGSFTLLGVADEWDCLEEGEIYATVYDERTGKMQPILGPVTITRSPQIHPGDVQLVTAVNHPKLNHLTNVVIFSCK